MTPIVKSMLGTLHSVFNKAPGQIPVLSISYSAGFSWSIKDEILKITLNQPANWAARWTGETWSGGFNYPLTNTSVGALHDRLLADGISVDYLNNDFLAANYMAAGLGLIGGSGAVSNSAMLYAPSNQLWIHLAAVGKEYGLAFSSIKAVVNELILPKATGVWADYWGALFGISRKASEINAEYTQRIVTTATRKKSNAYALRAIVKQELGVDVDIFEPWTKTFTLSKSKLSGGDKLPSGDYWCYHTAQVIAPSGTDLTAVMQVINTNKPAGTVFIAPRYA